MLSFFFIIVFLPKYLFWQELKILIKITLIISNILPKNTFKRFFNNSRIKDLKSLRNLLIPILEMSWNRMSERKIIRKKKLIIQYNSNQYHIVQSLSPILSILTFPKTISQDKAVRYLYRIISSSLDFCRNTCPDNDNREQIDSDWFAY